MADRDARERDDKDRGADEHEDVGEVRRHRADHERIGTLPPCWCAETTFPSTPPATMPAASRDEPGGQHREREQNGEQNDAEHDHACDRW